MTRPPFELRILGPTELIGPAADATDALARQTKRLALLAYLAVTSAEGFRRRDQVVALFWPELDQSTGRTYLRKALHGIRDTLGADLFLARAEDEVRVSTEMVSCDVVQLRAAARDGRWHEALALYRGELLEGLFPEGVAQEFQEWLSAERERLREIAARVAWECAAAEEARGDRIAATMMAQRARDLDPDNEEGVRRLLELLDRRGDRGTALRVYAEWQARLQEEYGVGPAPETRKLARRIQAARTGESHDTPALPPSALRAPAGVRPSAGETTVPAPRIIGFRAPVLRLGLTLATVCLVGWAIWTTVKTEEIRSLTIQPLRSIGDVEAQSLALATTELLGTRLAAALDVAVRMPVPVSLDQSSASVVPRARADYVTDGAVQYRTGSAVLTLRLLRSSDGLMLWVGEYRVSGAPGDIPGVLADSAGASLKAWLDSQRR